MRVVASVYLVFALLTTAALPSAAVSKDRRNGLELAQQNFRAAGDAWSACIMNAAPRFLNSTESAESIATAILGACSGEQDGVRMTLIPIFGLTSPYNSLQQSIPYAENAAANKIEAMRSSFRDKLISIVVERRSQSSGN